ncbi:hypothetical protein [Reticulibacter mediterranei]|uniref:hypothetical protein n=1 Tax=Reticulibacter mediterranei TaxID=2778369 RepID=UPI001C68FBA1|nr:hypothetical protein [Reticulibacter mediterranei]
MSLTALIGVHQEACRIGWHAKRSRAVSLRARASASIVVSFSGAVGSRIALVARLSSKAVNVEER